MLLRVMQRRAERQRHRVVGRDLGLRSLLRQRDVDPLVREDVRALDRVAQLAHVAGPRVCAQRGDRRVGQPLVRTMARVERIDEFLRDRLDVAFALTQRRHVQRERGEAIEQVLAQPAVAHGFGRVVAGRGHDPHVERNRLGAADAHDRVRLERAQQLHLQRRRHFGDLVEQQRAAARGFEEALALRDRAGEAAFLVTEQLRLGDVGRNRAAIDRDERAVAAFAELVQPTRDDVFADAAFAGDHHARAGRRDLFDTGQQRTHRGGAAGEPAAVCALLRAVCGFTHRY
ncbi:hypothetical protein BDSB_19375 [Burkholderia dolosa PC543]|nr:hypothetical protein BDSB_19375 [Burkholderia dolosa PC543]